MIQENMKRIQVYMPESLWQEATDRAYDENFSGLSEYLRDLIRRDLAAINKAEESKSEK